MHHVICALMSMNRTFYFGHDCQEFTGFRFSQARIIKQTNKNITNVKKSVQLYQRYT